MAKELFSEFPPSNKSAWETQVELESKKPLKELIQNSDDNTKSCTPYYSFEEFDSNKIAEVTDCQKKTSGWLNTPEISFIDEKLSAEKIRNAITGGAQALLLHLENNLSNGQLSRLLHNIRLTDTPVYFKTRQNPEFIFDLVSQGTGYSIKGGIANDPLANWMRSSANFDLKDLVNLCKKTEAIKDFYPLMVESHIFHNAGANPRQELAFLLGSLSFYLDKLTDSRLAPELAIKSIFLSVSVGTNYLQEITKLRALRLLHKRITSAYGLDQIKVFIHASTSPFYNSETLPHTNILRATTSAMSAVIGGCDALTVQTFDGSFSHPDNFSERIARNISSIIAHESYLGQVADPAAGSYYIENESLQLAESAWELFLEIENKGGITACFESGFIQDEIDRSWNDKLMAMKNGQVIVGVNKYLEDQAIVSNSVYTEDKPYKGFRTLGNRNLAATWHLHHQKL